MSVRQWRVTANETGRPKTVETQMAGSQWRVTNHTSSLVRDEAQLANNSSAMYDPSDAVLIIQGRVALCLHCGILSEDLIHCTGCQHRFPNSIRVLGKAGTTVKLVKTYHPVKKQESIECKVCYRAYNTAELRPKVLPCGHTFCNGCLTEYIKHERLTCPGCRKRHNCIAASQLPVNYLVEELMEKGDNNATEDANSGMCPEHNNELIFRCVTHKCWLCDDCVAENHPRKQCKVISCRNEINNRKKEQQDDLSTNVDNCEKTVDEIKKYVIHLEKEVMQHDTLLKEIFQITEKHNHAKTVLNEEIKNMKELLTGGRKIHENLEKEKQTVNKVCTLQESNISRENVKKQGQESCDWRKQAQHKFSQEERTALDLSLKVRLSSGMAIQFRRTCMTGMDSPMTEGESPEEYNNQYGDNQGSEDGEDSMEEDDDEDNDDDDEMDDSDTADESEDNENEAEKDEEKNPSPEKQDKDVEKFVVEDEISVLAKIRTNIAVKMISDALKPNEEIFGEYGPSLIQPLDKLNKYPQSQWIYSILCESMRSQEWCKNKTLAYALHYEKDGTCMVSRVKVRNGQLHLHALTSNIKIPANAVTIPYEPIRDMVKGSYCSVFMDIGWGHKIRGRVYAKVQANTGRGLQFVWYCTGEKGASYRGTPFVSHEDRGNPGEWIGTGSNDYTVLPPLVENLSSGDLYNYSQEAGLITAVAVGKKASSQNGRFGICIRDNQNDTSIGFARVESGMSVLEYAAKHFHVTHSYIADCGLVIPIERGPVTDAVGDLEDGGINILL